MASFKPLNYTHPKFWPTWLGLGFLRVTAVLPWRVQQAIGTGLGWLAYYLAGSRRRVAQVNINLCFPELTEQARAQLVKRSFYSLGKGLMEVGTFWHTSPKRYLALSTLHGQPHLDQALSEGNVLLLGVHFTCLESGVRLLKEKGYSMQGMYKPAKNKLFEAYMTHQRQTHYERIEGDKIKGGMIPNTQSKRFAERLAHGQLSWYAPDQSFSRSVIHAPFFGIETASLTSTQRLSASTGCKVLPMFGIRTKNGYAVHILPALENFPSGDDAQDTLAVNHAMEQMIRYAPEQYLWVHKRFKHMPNGSNPYQK